jgi:chromosomal replication initiation ATPase DnaA
MFFAVSTKTMAGARQRAAQRIEALPPTIPAPASETAPRGSNIVRLVIPKTEMQLLIESIARQHGVAVADIMGKTLADRVLAARFDAIAAVKKARPNISFPALGRMFNRDSASVRNALKKRGLA